ncbi:MAG TPA: hypothetical protein VF667_09765 [Pseudonocardia sp.]
MPTAPVENMQRSCGGCEVRWYGPYRCHCSGCHETFDDDRAFRRHRPSFRCRPPESLGMHLVGSVWTR